MIVVLIVLGVACLLLSIGFYSQPEIENKEECSLTGDSDCIYCHEFSRKIMYYDVIDDIGVHHLYIFPVSLVDLLTDIWCINNVSVVRLETLEDVQCWIGRHRELQGHLRCVNLIKDIGYATKCEKDQVFVLNDFSVL